MLVGAHVVQDVKSFEHRDLDAVKQSAAGRRNLVLALGALPVVHPVSLAVSGMATLGAYKTIFPAQLAQVVQTGLVVREAVLEIEYCQALKHLFHRTVIFPSNLLRYMVVVNSLIQKIFS